MTEKIGAVQRMQDYIKTNITEEISLADLAEAAHFSPWYSARIFKELTGFSPAAYIRRARLSKSVLLLRDSNIKVIDAAFDTGFVSVDGYQRAFLKEFGCNPKEYAKKPIPLSLFIAYGVKFKELLKKERLSMEIIKNVFIQVVEKPERKVIIKRGINAVDYFDYCKEVGCDVWGVLTSIKTPFDEPVCLWLPEKYRKPNTSEYVQGTEVPVDFDGAIPEGFDIITLPQAKFLMFQSEPFPEEEYCDVILSLQEAIKKYNPTPMGYIWDDENPRIQLEPIGERGYMELKAIKEIKK